MKKITFLLFLAMAVISYGQYVSIEPPVVPPKNIGETFVCSLRVHDVINLHQWQIVVKYEHNVLQPIGINEGPFLKQNDYPTLFVPGWNDTSHSLVSAVCLRWTGSNQSGAYGTGDLVYFTFRVISTGNSKLDIVDHEPTCNARTYYYATDSTSTGPVEKYGIPFVNIDGYYGTQTGGGNFAISTAVKEQAIPSCVWADTQYLVVWQDCRDAAYALYDLYGQRISATGNLLASNFSLGLSYFSDEVAPAVAWNDSNFIITYEWMDVLSDSTNDCITANSVSRTGQVGSEITIKDTFSFQVEPAIAYDNGNHRNLVVWEDHRKGQGRGDPDIYGRFVNRNLTLTGPNFVICNTSDSAQSTPDVIWNGMNYLAVWTQGDTTTVATKVMKVKGQFISPTGSLVGTSFVIAEENGRRCCLPAVAFDGSNFLCVFMAEPTYYTNSWGVYGQRISPDGSLLGSRFVISDDQGAQCSPDVAWDDSSYLVVWHDDRNGPQDIYGQRVLSNGNLLGTEFIISNAAYQQVFPSVTGGNSGALVVWQDYRSGTDYNIYGTIISSDVIPPKSSYITRAEKTGSDVKLYWNKITQDTLGNPETIDYYVIYRSADPAFIPGPSDSIAGATDTFYTDVGVLDSTESYYYLIKAVDMANNRSAKSNMGYALRKAVNENEGATGDRNWASLPWHSGYATVLDLTTDLSPAGTPLSKITRLRDDQVFENWIYHSVLGWYGDTFAIEPGRGYEMIAAVDDTVFLVGSNDPDGLISLNENAGATGDRNWVSIPYNAVYARVIDITDEFSSGGEVVAKITNLRDGQLFENWIYHPVLGWYGDTFAIESGRGYEMVAVTDGAWNPTEYSNVAFRQMQVGRRANESGVVVSPGELTEVERMPVWVLSKDGYILATRVHRTTHREAGISHVVRADLVLEEFDDLVFTAYRPDDPFDVLTEQVIGCGVAHKDAYHVLWFDAGNFKKTWQDGEGVILIVEARRNSKGYFTVVELTLDQGSDIQELGELELVPIPGLHSLAGGLNVFGSETIIGYSVYEGDKRLNTQILTNEYTTNTDVVVRPVFRGGYETVYASHGAPAGLLPHHYACMLYPNPFTRETTVDFALPIHTPVAVKVYDVSGKLVKTLVSGTQKPGYYNVFWRGDDNRGQKVAAGVYFVQINAEGFESQHKVIFVR